MADGSAPGSWTGLVGMTEGWRQFRRVWAEYHFAPQKYRELDGERVLVRGRFIGRRKASEPAEGPTRSNAARLFHIRDGKVTRLVLYAEADSALADLGLKEWRCRRRTAKASAPPRDAGLAK